MKVIVICNPAFVSKSELYRFIELLATRWNVDAICVMDRMANSGIKMLSLEDVPKATVRQIEAFLKAGTLESKTWPQRVWEWWQSRRATE